MLSLDFELVIDIYFLYKHMVQVIYHHIEFIKQRPLTYDVFDKPFDIMQLFLKLIVLIVTQRKLYSVLII